MKIKFLKDYKDQAKAGDIAEVQDEVNAKGLIASGYAEECKEEDKEAKEVVAKVDTKELGNVISENFKALLTQNQTQEQETSKKFKSIGELAQAIYKGVNITDNADGAYVTTELVDGPELDVLSSAQLAQLANIVRLTGTNNQYKFNTVTSVGGSPSIVAEGTAIGDSQPVITQYSVELAKLSYVYYATEESLQDTGGLTSEINQGVTEDFAKTIQKSMLDGTLSSFTGIIGDTNTVTVAKESGQTADTITSGNIYSMYQSQENPGRAVWIMSRSALNQVMGLVDANSNALFYGPQRAIAESPWGTLMGRPIIVEDFSTNAIGDVGDILFADLSKYKLCMKNGLEVAQSDHFNFDEAQTVFRFIERIGGTPISKIKTTGDGTEVSAFVELAARA